MAELKQGRRTTPWVGAAIGVALLLLMLVGWCGALVRPEVIPDDYESREANANLRAVFAAEKAYRTRTGHFTESIEAIGFVPEPYNRYRYVFSQTGDSLQPGDPPDGGTHTGTLADSAMRPEVDNARLLSGIPASVLRTAGIDSTGITVIAAGNVDSDPTIDVWSVSTNNRMIDGGFVKAGVPFRHVNDSEL